MVAVDPPEVVAVYSAREHAEQLVALLREHGFSAVAAPSDRYVGEWDVLVAAGDAGRAAKMVCDLLRLE